MPCSIAKIEKIFQYKLSPRGSVYEKYPIMTGNIYFICVFIADWKSSDILGSDFFLSPSLDDLVVSGVVICWDAEPIVVYLAWRYWSKPVTNGMTR